MSEVIYLNFFLEKKATSVITLFGGGCSMTEYCLFGLFFHIHDIDGFPPRLL